jgi:hypothetical protein
MNNCENCDFIQGYKFNGYEWPKGPTSCAVSMRAVRPNSYCEYFQPADGPRMTLDEVINMWEEDQIRRMMAL